MTHEADGAPTPIVRADPGHRKRLALAIVVVFAVGVGVTAWFEPRAQAWLEAYESHLANRTLDELLRDYRLAALLVGIGSAVPLALLASVFLYQAYRVKSAKQYPYPGMMLLRDAPLETGSRARRRFRRLLIVGVSLLVTGGVIGWFLFTLLMRLAEATAHRGS